MGKIRRELQALDPDKWIVLIGATEEGIGGAYSMARDMGLETMGLVSMQALTYSGKFSRFVDRIFIVNDPNWGGSGTPTTEAFVEISDVISAHGGGENTAAVLRRATERDKQWRHTPAEMNHVNAAKDAAQSGRTPPIDFKGAGYRAAKGLQSKPR
jgi:hypothetical protein